MINLRQLKIIILKLNGLREHGPAINLKKGKIKEELLEQMKKYSKIFQIKLMLFHPK